MDWLLPPGARQVLDLGAGTGKLGAVLVERGADVVALDPSPAMLERLQRAVPGARALVGSAEAVPLPGACVDAVVVAQAWHWVDPARAVPEVARVLRAGGSLALLRNVPRDQGGWPAALGELLDQRTGSAGARDDGEPLVGGPLAPLESCEVAWTHHLSREQMVDAVASRSAVITLPDHARRDLLARVRQLLDTHPDLAGSKDLAVPCTAHCYRTRLR